MNLAQESDESLMARVAGGDRRAFETLAARHLSRAYAIARRYLFTTADAEDAVQDAFTKLWINAASWQQGRAAFSTWFYRIIANACIDHGRRQPPPGEHDAAEYLESTLPDAEASAIAAQERAQLHAALGQLPDRQRMAVLLCYGDELTNPEAARIMGIHLKALEGLLVRARRTLRQILPSQGEKFHDAA